MFVTAPPSSSTWRSEQAVQKSPARRFKSPFWKNTALRPFPNVEGCPGIFLQHLLQPQLIGGVEGTLSLQAGGHQFGNVAVFGDGHADHRPLRHGRVVFAALQCARVVLDLHPDEEQRGDDANEPTICAR